MLKSQKSIKLNVESDVIESISNHVFNLKMGARPIKRIIQKKMGWCNDSRSSKYNKEIKFPFKYDAEKLYRKDRIYDLFINIKYQNEYNLRKLTTKQ